MSNNYGGGGGGDDGGGFMGASQQGSQGAQGAKTYGDESLRPVTIKQLADWNEPFPGADVQIDGVPLTQLTLVGQIRKINPQATNITYTLDDGTATIDVKKWVDAERADDSDAEFQVDQQVRIWGRLKSFNGKKHVGAHFIRAVDDYNEVQYHLVEAAYVHLYITKGPPVPGQQAAATTQGQKGQDGESMFVDDAGYGAAGGNRGGAGGETPQQKLAQCHPNSVKFYNYLANTAGSNEGLHVDMIKTGTGMSLRDTLAAGEELNSCGLVYTTVDDETFAILEY